MSLSHHEKKSFFRFITVYTGAVLTVIVIFGALFYKIEKESIKDNTFNTLRVFAFEIASSAIDAQMQNKKFAIPHDIEYILFDSNKNIIKSNFKDTIDFKKEFYIKDGCAYYVDRGAKGHLGISYIVVRECSYHDRIYQTLYHTLIISVVASIFLMVVGWYLGILFLKPMKEQIGVLDRFIKDSTHELNTPITTMLLALEKLEQNPNNNNYLKSLKMSANLIFSTYSDISYISLKNPYHDIQDIDISQHIYKNLEFFDILIEQKKLKLYTKLSPCKTKANSKEIDMLIKNLIDNAVKYSNPYQSLEVVLQECQLSITNTGTPIPKDKLKEIWTRYKRADKIHGGFGIGLDIVYTICKKYGYSVDVVSKDNKTTFSITFHTHYTKK